MIRTIVFFPLHVVQFLVGLLIGMYWWAMYGKQYLADRYFDFTNEMDDWYRAHPGARLVEFAFSLIMWLFIIKTIIHHV